MRAAGNVAAAFAVGALGGSAFWLAGLPLPWMLGSLTASAIVAVNGRPWLMPVAIRDLARPVIGLLAGSAFTPAVMASLPLWWPALLLVLCFTLASLGAGYFYFTRFAKLDRATAFFASSPGGLAELTLLGGTLGGDVRGLVMVHALRIVVVVTLLPLMVQTLLGQDLSGSAAPARPNQDGALFDWLVLGACGVAGYILARRVRVPGGVMVTTLVFSALVHGLGVTEMSPPAWIVSLVLVVIGASTGARFVGIRWREVGGLLTHGLIWTAILLGLSLSLAAAGMLLTDQPYLALVLAFSPGGTAEMTIIAYAIGVEAAFVIACQVSRIFMVYTIAPLLFPVLRRSDGAL
ncbi:AbrB family transcriptional regulator [Roseitranquillus sediminis]|uniref:AbrB family transcriptional regulator n=1 Tax=Roseitranquillus sediminis TaxID=2809051 RepID=UPI0029C9E6A0|nr:AbrB family transcriptional regulator [Roseitranquillus sediminis]MBM9595475.1 AbrB family transcriptional regulator [Roseitranquillus sediminis]